MHMARPEVRRAARRSACSLAAERDIRGRQLHLLWPGLSQAGSAGSQAQRMEMWPQGRVCPSLSGRISFQVPAALPAHTISFSSHISCYSPAALMCPASSAPCSAQPVEL